MRQLEESNATFRTTRWTLVEALHGPDEGERAAALDHLFRMYWPAVYAYVRHRGMVRDEAAEATQAFFAEVAVGRDLFGRAEAGRGRLRTLIKTALRRFLVDRQRREAARGKGRALPLEQIEREEALLPELAGSGGDAEAAMEKRWALAILHEALERSRRHYTSIGKGGHWTAFEARVLRPSGTGTAAPPLEAVARESGFRGAADAAAAVQVVKKRVVALLREVIEEHATDPAEREEDFGRVLGVLG
jgi:DNA-directed RNA polymerase specialized sigma24 family protein